MVFLVYACVYFLYLIGFRVLYVVSNIQDHVHFIIKLCFYDPNRELVIVFSLSVYDENFEFHEEQYDGMKARIIQHEYDHIEGILFLDHLTPLRRRLLQGKLNDISRGKVDTTYRILAPLKK